MCPIASANDVPPFAPSIMQNGMEEETCPPPSTSFSRQEASMTKNDHNNARRSVSFCEEHNRYYENEWKKQQQHDHWDELWYSAQELLRFRSQTLELARRLILADQQCRQQQIQQQQQQQEEKGQETSTITDDKKTVQYNSAQQLALAYKRFCCCTLTNETEAPEASLPLDDPNDGNRKKNEFGRPMILAMEKWVIRCAGKDRLSRRKQLYVLVQRWQKQHQHADRNDVDLGRDCERISWPVRRWAQHVAWMVSQCPE